MIREESRCFLERKTGFWDTPLFRVLSPYISKDGSLDFGFGEAQPGFRDRFGL